MKSKRRGVYLTASSREKSKAATALVSSPIFPCQLSNCLRSNAFQNSSVFPSRRHSLCRCVILTTSEVLTRFEPPPETTSRPATLLSSQLCCTSLTNSISALWAKLCWLFLFTNSSILPSPTFCSLFLESWSTMHAATSHPRQGPGVQCGNLQAHLLLAGCKRRLDDSHLTWNAASLLYNIVV